MNLTKSEFKKSYSTYRKDLKTSRGDLEKYITTAKSNNVFQKIRFELELPVSLKIWAYKKQLN